MILTNEILRYRYTSVCPCLRYPGVKIDRALTFKKHLEKVKNKLDVEQNYCKINGYELG